MAAHSAKPNTGGSRTSSLMFFARRYRMRYVVAFLTLLQAFCSTPLVASAEAKCAPTVQYAMANDKMLDFLHRTNADLYPLYSSGGATGYLGQVQNEVEKLLHGGNANSYEQHLKERANMWVHDTRATWMQKVTTDQYLKLSVCLGDDKALQCSWLTPLVCSTVTPGFTGGVTVRFGAQKLGISCEGIFQLVKFVNPASPTPTLWEVDKMFLRQNQGFAPKPISGNGSTNNGFYLENMADSSLVGGEWVLDVNSVSKHRQNWVRVANQSMSTCPKQYPRMHVPKFGHEFRQGGMICSALPLDNSIANYGTLFVSMATQIDDVARSSLPCQNIQSVLTYTNLLGEYGPTLFLRFNGLTGWYMMLSQLSSGAQTAQPTGNAVLPGTDAFKVKKAFEASTLCILDCYNGATEQSEDFIEPCLDACTPGGSLSKEYGTTISIPRAIYMTGGQAPVGYYYPVDTVLRKYPANLCHANNSVTVPGGPQPKDAGWWYTSSGTKMPVAEYCWKDESRALLSGGGFMSTGLAMISKLLSQNTSDVGIDLPSPQVKDGPLVTAWLQLLQTIVIATATTLFGLWITKSSGTVDSAASFFRKCFSCEPCLKFVILTAVVIVIGAYNTAALVLLVRSIRQATGVVTISTVAVNQTTSIADVYVVELLTITQTSQRAWPGLVMLPLYLAILVAVVFQALYSVFNTKWTDRTRFMASMEYKPSTEMQRGEYSVVDMTAKEPKDAAQTDDKNQSDDLSFGSDSETDPKTAPAVQNGPTRLPDLYP